MKTEKAKREFMAQLEACVALESPYYDDFIYIHGKLYIKVEKVLEALK